MRRIAVLKEGRHSYLFGCFFNGWDPERIDAARTAGSPPYNEDFTNFQPKLPLEDLGIKIAYAWDYDFAAAKTFAQTFDGIEAVEEASDLLSCDLDGVFLSETREDGTDHRALAEPFLRAGIPVFVDKPLSNSLQGARSMIQTAKESGTALACGSLLGRTPSALALRDEAEKIGACALTVAGFGPLVAYGVHLVSIAHAIYGTDVRSVHSVGNVDCDHIRLNWGTRKGYEARTAVLHLLHRGNFFDYDVALYGDEGQAYRKIERDEYLTGAYSLVLDIKQMIETGQPPIPYATMIEELKILLAARLSQTLGREVALRELDRNRVFDDIDA